MKRLEPDWERVERDARRKNTEEVLLLLENRDRRLMTRIKKFSRKHEIPEGEIEQEIRRSRTVRAEFAMSPKRQNIFEDEVKEFLEKHLAQFGVAVRKLPSKGKSALYIDQNGKIRGKSRGNDRRLGKSLDFEVKLGDRFVYISHKFTEEGGGMQDSQFDEQLGKLMKFQQSEDINKHFAAACDGKYYTDKKMSQLKARTRQQAPFSTAGTCGEVLEFIREMFSIGQVGQP